LTLTCTLLGLSFKDIDADEMGIRLHNLAKTIREDKVYGQGKHYVLPGYYFEKFKSRNQWMMFEGRTAQTCISKDGVQMSVESVFNYRVMNDSTELVQILRDFGNEKELQEYVRMLARESMLYGCSLFQAQEFYSKREEMFNEMRTHFQKACKDYGGHVNGGEVMLTAITMPSKLRFAVIEKLRAKANIDSAINAERVGALLDAEIEQNVANITTRVEILQAEANAAAVIQAAQLEVKGITEQYKQRAAAWSNFKDINQLTEDEFLSGYIMAIAMQNSSLPVYSTS
jgi:regulator of protease activity HflC (stomatin/prohibitin superfamily)